MELFLLSVQLLIYFTIPEQVMAMAVGNHYDSYSLPSKFIIVVVAIVLTVFLVSLVKRPMRFLTNIKLNILNLLRKIILPWVVCVPGHPVILPALSIAFFIV